MEDALKKTFLVPCDTVEHLRDWVYTFLDVDLPLGHIDSDSNSSPAEWLFEAYNNLRNNLGGQVPGYIIYSCREGYKTYTASILAILAIVHFGFTVAHMASIETQSSKAIQYVELFLQKIKPFLEMHGRIIESQNKRNIAIRRPDGEIAYLTIVVCTVTGANSPHVTLFIVDEVDIVRFPNAYQEAKLIPAMYKGQFPLTIKISTRKYAFGLMQREMDLAPQTNEKILHWNILDITEYCPPSRCLPHLSLVKRFIPLRLPLRNLSEAQWLDLDSTQRKEYTAIMAYHGCSNCKLLSVCKMNLAKRPSSNRGGLYKPIEFTISQFERISPDMAEAQLLCWRPSATGLVYSRFNDTINTGNVCTLLHAYSVLTGDASKKDVTLHELVQLMLLQGIDFKAAVDWGFRHCFAITVHALLPNREWWIVDTRAVSGLEFEDMIKLAEEVRDLYHIVKWYPDNSQPMFIKAFRKRKMPCVNFKKDVLGGIEAVRGQIINAANKRFLKILLHERNEFLIKGMKTHHFKLDAQGNPTQEPDDDEYADVCDTVRYFAQNHFVTKGTIVSLAHDNQDITKAIWPQMHDSTQKNDWLSNKIHELVDQDINMKGKSTSGKIIWDFSGDVND